MRSNASTGLPVVGDQPRPLNSKGPTVFEPTTDSTVAELEAEVKDLTDHLTQAREFIQFQINYRASMATRYDKIILGMRQERDAEAALWVSNHRPAQPFSRWTQFALLAGYLVLALVIVLTGATR
jgi:hypothetical protein